MKKYLETNYDNLNDFYSNIHNTDDLAVCMVASLYANKDDIVEWIKAKVFLPENYIKPYWWNLDNNTETVLNGEQNLNNWENK